MHETALCFAMWPVRNIISDTGEAFMQWCVNKCLNIRAVDPKTFYNTKWFCCHLLYRLLLGHKVLSCMLITSVFNSKHKNEGKTVISLFYHIFNVFMLCSSFNFILKCFNSTSFQWDWKRCVRSQDRKWSGGLAPSQRWQDLSIIIRLVLCWPHWRNLCIWISFYIFIQSIDWLSDFCTLSFFESIRKRFSSVLLSGHKRGAWSLVCDTEEQWVRLAESIKDKTSPQDRHLYRVISQNFLPEISSMIEHKVRPKRHYNEPPLQQLWLLLNLNLHFFHLHSCDKYKLLSERCFHKS